MRSIAKAALATLLALVASIPPAAAQDATSSSAAAALPKAPVPYTSLNPPPRPKVVARPRPAQAMASTPAASAAPPPTSQVAALPTLPNGARLAAGQPLPPAELEAFVDGVVRDSMSRDHIAGATVSVVQNGQILLKKGYGFASLSPARRVNPDTTLFRVGSISKTFTWIALMREVEAGRIRLDRPVNLYLPERLQIRDQGFDRPVNVINLMDHSAGFEDRILGHGFERTVTRERSLADYLRQERPRRVRIPGAASSYSNYGAALAGEAVVYVSGKPFERLIEEQILLPLRLGHTTFRELRPERRGLPGAMPAQLAADVSDGFRWTPDGYERRPYELIGHAAPAGSASSTAGDMARYMLMLLNGGSLEGRTIYGPRTAQAFRTPIRRTPPGVNGWRHGMVEYALPGGYTGFGHPGATLSFMSNLVVVPELNLGVFISTNTDTGWDLGVRLPELVVQQFYSAPPALPRPPSRALVDARRVYEGYYVTTRRAYGGLEAFVGLLRGGMEVFVTDAGRLVTRRDGETKTWTPEGDDPLAGRFVASTGHERLAFRIVDGKADSVVPATGDVRFEREGAWARPATLVILAALAGLAAVLTLVGLAMRDRREFRQTSIQARASLAQNIQAGLWLTAISLFGVWAAGTGDVAEVMFRWPGPWLIIASACALVAAALTVLTLAGLPVIWRGGRRVDSWGPGRKLAFSVTVLVYAAFSVVLGFWGALSLWDG